MIRKKNLGDSVSLGSQDEWQFDFEHGKYRGTFVMHRPTIKERLTIGVVEANLLGNTNRDAVDVVTRNIAHMVSTFKHVVDECPDWFDLESLTDYSVLEALYLKFMEKMSPFREGLSEDEANSGASNRTG